VQPSNDSASSCHSCGAGKFGGNGIVCDLCSSGRFRSGNGDDATLCRECPRGYSQKDDGQAACIRCIPGTFEWHKDVTNANDARKGGLLIQVAVQNACHAKSGSRPSLTVLQPVKTVVLEKLDKIVNLARKEGTEVVVILILRNVQIVLLVFINQAKVKLLV